MENSGNSMIRSEAQSKKANNSKDAQENQTMELKGTQDLGLKATNQDSQVEAWTGD